MVVLSCVTSTQSPHTEAELNHHSGTGLVTQLQLPHARHAHVGVTGAVGLVKWGEPWAEPGECQGALPFY